MEASIVLITIDEVYPLLYLLYFDHIYNPTVLWFDLNFYNRSPFVYKQINNAKTGQPVYHLRKLKVGIAQSLERNTNILPELQNTQTHCQKRSTKIVAKITSSQYNLIPLILVMHQHCR